MLPFADHLSRLAVEYPLDVFSSFRGNSSFISSLRGNSSFGGGRGSLHNVSGSVPMCILRERRLNLATNDWINHADNDLRCLKRGLAYRSRDDQCSAGVYQKKYGKLCCSANNNLQSMRKECYGCFFVAFVLLCSVQSSGSRFGDIFFP